MIQWWLLATTLAWAAVLMGVFPETFRVVSCDSKTQESAVLGGGKVPSLWHSFRGPVKEVQDHRWPCSPPSTSFREEVLTEFQNCQTHFTQCSLGVVTWTIWSWMCWSKDGVEV